jgi:hypothetical protein
MWLLLFIGLVDIVRLSMAHEAWKKLFFEPVLDWWLTVGF